VRVPGFIVRQFYVGGSLRNAGDGFELQARNPMGDGALVGIRSIAVDGNAIEPTRVSARRNGSDEVIPASAVSPQTPVSFRKGDAVTFHVAGHSLGAGKHKLELEIIERNAGLLQLSLEDKLNAG
jgi:hypothetical protein